MFGIFKPKLDKFHIDVFTEDIRGRTCNKSVDVTKTGKKHIYRILTKTGQIIRVEIS